MALAAPIISFQNGLAAAAVNASNNSTIFADAGVFAQIALQSSSGVQSATITLLNTAQPNTAGTFPVQFPTVYQSPFSWGFITPSYPATFSLTVEATDGFNISTANYTIVVGLPAGKTAGSVHRARNVVITNQGTLSTYAVAAAAQNDNVSGGNVQGDIVLLVNQSTTSQNGLYVVGVVSGGNAPLTRVPDFATGTVLQAGQTCEIDAGTVFANSTWKIMTAGPITVDTTNHQWMPRMHRFTVAVGTPVTTVFAWANTGANGSKAIGTDQTAANAVKLVVSGAPSAGGATVTATGTGTDSIDAAVLNW